jgi:hypothetical protein
MTTQILIRPGVKEAPWPLRETWKWLLIDMVTREVTERWVENYVDEDTGDVVSYYCIQVTSFKGKLQWLKDMMYYYTVTHTREKHYKFIKY